MEMLVLSDIHGERPNARKIIEKHNAIEHIFFLGDGVNDIETIKGDIGKREFHIVQGNMDGETKYKNNEIVMLGGKKIFCTHGDNFNVKIGMEDIKYRAEKEKADIVLFGHTHNVYIEEDNGIYYVNPGAVASAPPSYAIITIDGNEIKFKILEL